MLSVGHDKGSVDRAEVMRWILNRNGLLLIVARFDIFHLPVMVFYLAPFADAKLHDLSAYCLRNIQPKI